MTDDELLQRVWKLTNDLTIQQQTNQDIATGLKTQVETFKHATNDNDDADLDLALPAHLPSDTTDTMTSMISKHRQLLQDHRHIKTRNQELEKECNELQDLVKQYEENLELITGKLRVYANSSSEGQAQLRREYQALLDAEKDTTTALFMENTMLQSQLIKLSGVLRSNYELDSTSTLSHDAKLEQLEIENKGLRTMLGISDHSPVLSTTLSKPLRQVGKPSSQVIQDYFGEKH